MKIIKIKAYSFNELSEEAQQRAIEENQDINVFDDWWHEGILKDWEEKLNDLGYKDVEILYSGFNCQGDGACFTGSVDILKWIKAHKAKTRFSKLYKEVEEGFYAYISITHHGNYYHSRSVAVDFEGESELSDKAYDQLKEVAGWVEQEAEELGDKIYKELEDEYFYQTSEEAIRETLIANDYVFTKEGKSTYYL